MEANVDETALRRDSFDLELHEAFRSRVTHEDFLISHRVNFLLVATAIMLTAYFTARKDASLKDQSSQAEIYNAVISVIPLCGFILSLTACLGVIAAWKAIAFWVEEAKKNIGDNNFPLLHSPPKISLWGVSPAMASTTIMCVLWGCVAAYSYLNIQGVQSFIATNLSALITGPVVLVLTVTYMKKRMERTVSESASGK